MAMVSIHHVGLVPRDAERSLDYYTRVLGLTVLAQSASSQELCLGSADGEPGSMIPVVEPLDFFADFAAGRRSA